jgi:predicted lipoprotein
MLGSNLAYKFFSKRKTTTMKYISLLTIALVLLAFGCKKDKDKDEEKFDRELMLKNYAENLIIPAYQDASTALNQLSAQIDAFLADKNITNLENAQTAWLHAFEEWQFACMFNVGPAAEQGLNKSLNEEIATFPASETKINNILSSGQFNMNDFNRDARGFLAIEYLLFGGITVSNADVLNLFQTQPNRATYLQALISHSANRVNTVLTAWNGAYKNEFIKNNGTDVGSSTSQLYNEFVKSFETIKNLKLELPLGLRPGQTQTEPQLVQAYYSGYSLKIIKKHTQAIENVYLGRSKSNVEGSSFRDYLATVVGGPELITQTLNQWANVMAAQWAVPTDSPMSVQINANPQPLLDFREELQKHTRFFKSDMSSRLGIAITFSSGDGD